MQIGVLRGSIRLHIPGNLRTAEGKAQHCAAVVARPPKEKVFGDCMNQGKKLARVVGVEPPATPGKEGTP